MTRLKKTPIQRMFLKILHRRMSAAERRVLLRKRSPKLKAT